MHPDTLKKVCVQWMTFHQELINNCNTFTSNPVQRVEMEEDKVWCGMYPESAKFKTATNKE